MRDELWAGFYAAFVLGRLGDFTAASRLAALSKRSTRRRTGQRHGRARDDHVERLIGRDGVYRHRRLRPQTLRIAVGGAVLGFAEYRRRPGVISSIHTEIDLPNRGERPGNTARQDGAGHRTSVRVGGAALLPIRPGFIDRHREYLDLVPVSDKVGIRYQHCPEFSTVSEAVITFIETYLTLSTGSDPLRGSVLWKRKPSLELPTFVTPALSGTDTYCETTARDCRLARRCRHAARARPCGGSAAGRQTRDRRCCARIVVTFQGAFIDWHQVTD